MNHRTLNYGKGLLNYVPKNNNYESSFNRDHRNGLRKIESDNLRSVHKTSNNRYPWMIIISEKNGKKKEENLSKTINNVNNSNYNFLTHNTLLTNYRVYSSLNEKQCLGVPLTNPIGENSCYINTIIQLLEKVKKLKKYIVSELALSSNRLLKEFSNLFKLIDHYKSEYQQRPLNTWNFRYILSEESKKKFTFGRDGDPVELLDYLLDTISIEKIGNKIVHDIFFIEITEEYKCSNCKNQESLNYDKNNFIYTSYINEIMNLCNEIYLLTFDKFCNNFPNLCKEVSRQHSKNCDKCKSHPLMIKLTTCKTIPELLLINCAWNEQKPDIKKIIQSYFMIPLTFDFGQLFESPVNDLKYGHHKLIGIVLFNYYRHHYIIIISEGNNDKWVVYNDEMIFFYKSYEQLVEVMVGKDGKNAYYPVLLVFQRVDGVKPENSLRNKELYEKLIKQNCIKEEQKKKILNEEKKDIKSTSINKSLEEKKNQEKISSTSIPTDDNLSEYEKFLKEEIEIERLKEIERENEQRKIEEKKYFNRSVSSTSRMARTNFQNQNQYFQKEDNKYNRKNNELSEIQDNIYSSFITTTYHSALPKNKPYNTNSIRKFYYNFY